ncbi:MAG: transposase [Tissierellia bacterium]|nr:transposase [Tissierellia bacterium]
MSNNIQNFNKQILCLNPSRRRNKALSKTDKKIGIDLGIKDFAVTSDGDKIINPKWLRKSEERIKKLQRDLSRKQKGSKNREKARLRLAKAYEKLVNQIRG